jgi:hypothetical protein
VFLSNPSLDFLLRRSETTSMLSWNHYRAALCCLVKPFTPYSLVAVRQSRQPRQRSYRFHPPRMPLAGWASLKWRDGPEPLEDNGRATRKWPVVCNEMQCIDVAHGAGASLRVYHTRFQYSVSDTIIIRISDLWISPGQRDRTSR